MDIRSVCSVPFRAQHERVPYTTDNEETTALPNELFARAIEITILECQVHQLQKENHELCLAWKKKYGIYQDEWKVWWKAGSLVVLDDRQLRHTFL